MATKELVNPLIFKKLNLVQDFANIEENFTNVASGDWVLSKSLAGNIQFSFADESSKLVVDNGMNLANGTFDYTNTPYPFFNGVTTLNNVNVGNPGAVIVTGKQLIYLTHQQN